MSIGRRQIWQLSSFSGRNGGGAIGAFAFATGATVAFATGSTVTGFGLGVTVGFGSAVAVAALTGVGISSTGGGPDGRSTRELKQILKK